MALAEGLEEAEAARSENSSLGARAPRSWRVPRGVEFSLRASPKPSGLLARVSVLSPRSPRSPRSERSPERLPRRWSRPRPPPSLGSRTSRPPSRLAWLVTPFAASVMLVLSLEVSFLPPNKDLNQPTNPLLAGPLAGLVVVGVVGLACALAATGMGLGSAIGAGASGKTPLIMGVWRLVGSCERRVTAVASSTSSTIL